MKRHIKSMSFQKGVEAIKPYVVEIETPRGSGTGFLCTYPKDKAFCAIATAAHVIKESRVWEEPIRIRHYTSGKIKLLKASKRVIFISRPLDTAVILFEHKGLPLPEATLNFIPKRRHCRVGLEIGWLGFPSVHPDLCFFAGRISCWLKNPGSYLVDGVAINGVSGGPAFYPKGKEICIIGSVSAYLPNREGITPGLAMISGVDQFLNVIKTLKDLDEAKEKEKEVSTGETKKEEPIKDNNKKDSAKQ